MLQRFWRIGIIEKHCTECQKDKSYKSRKNWYAASFSTVFTRCIDV